MNKADQISEEHGAKASDDAQAEGEQRELRQRQSAASSPSIAPVVVSFVTVLVSYRFEMCATGLLVSVSEMTVPMTDMGRQAVVKMTALCGVDSRVALTEMGARRSFAGALVRRRARPTADDQPCP